jgi:hypothetical protein
MSFASQTSHLVHVESRAVALSARSALEARTTGGYNLLVNRAEIVGYFEATARAFGTVGFLRNLRRRLGRPDLAPTEVPGHLVRDIGLPPFNRKAMTHMAGPSRR